MKRMLPARTHLNNPSPLRGEGRVRGETLHRCPVTTLTPAIPAGAHENLSGARSTARMSTGHSRQLRLTSLKGKGVFEIASSGNHERGFALVAAMFIVVVLAMLGIMMVTIGGMQRATATTAMRGTQAYFASRSGIEWGIFQAITASSCVASPPFTLSAPGLNGFAVTVQCASTQHREGGNTYNVYVITSTATSGTFGNMDHVSRILRVSVTDAPPP